MSLDSYVFAVPKGTDLETVKERFQNDEIDILHNWDNNDYLHSAMERIYMKSIDSESIRKVLICQISVRNS